MKEIRWNTPVGKYFNQHPSIYFCEHCATRAHPIAIWTLSLLLIKDLHPTFLAYIYNCNCSTLLIYLLYKIWGNLHIPLLHHHQHLTRNLAPLSHCEQFIVLLTHIFYLSTIENNTRCLHWYIKKSSINNNNSNNCSCLVIIEITNN